MHFDSIIKLKGEDLPQPRNGAPTTSDAYVSELRQEEGTLGFDGVVAFRDDGDYLQQPDSSDFTVGTNDYTIDLSNFSTMITNIEFVDKEILLLPNHNF